MLRFCLWHFYLSSSSHVGRSDPFVSIRVGNSRQEKYKTKVVYRTLNPVWNEEVTLAMCQKHEKLSIEVYVITCIFPVSERCL